MDQEIWRPVRAWKNGQWYSYEGLYEVSNLGKVRSLPRNGTCLHAKILVPLHRNRYLSLHLNSNNKTETFQLHRLVAWAFPEICGEWREGMQINHLDENTENDRAENLRWCSPKENCNWGSHNQRSKETRIKNGTYQNWNCRKAVKCYSKDGTFLKTYISIEEAAKETGAPAATIGKCCSGYEDKRGRHYHSAGGYLWKYA